jgi:hypothetical protein
MSILLVRHAATEQQRTNPVPIIMQAPEQPQTDDSESSGKEGVLMDVLSELDRERTKRAELEAEIRALKEAAVVAKKAQDDKIWFEKQQQVKLMTSTTAVTKKKEESKKQEKVVASSQQLPVGKRELIAMQTERNGYKELVDVLTADNDAISATMKTTKIRYHCTSFVCWNSCPMIHVRYKRVRPMKRYVQ